MSSHQPANLVEKVDSEKVITYVAGIEGEPAIRIPFLGSL